ncbi:MAG: HD domain-containing protein [Oscillospiraceae bacterium]|nr:HD domain-containing protein [Oscillospiraceae bacterium]
MFQTNMTNAVYHVFSRENTRRTKRAKALKNARKERFHEMIGEYRNIPDVESMERFVQHGNTSTLGHSENVAWISFLANEKLHLNADEKTLVEAALLHDFYLYDWHDTKSDRTVRKAHRHNHSDIACENAVERFEIPKKTQDAIRSHMWPVSIKKVPKSKEAAILCMADKYCAFVETIRMSKRLGLK